MTVKHQPATPLPWSVKHGNHVKAGPHDHSVAVAALTSSTQGADADANATYIARAANAYPKLIDALQKLMNEAYELDYGLWQERGLVPFEEMAEIATARALLRELGEDA